tara:strand:+ start:481 stop:693 length:213 start_codon:yes stop_codon:yes gene_type:complete
MLHVHVEDIMASHIPNREAIVALLPEKRCFTEKIIRDWSTSQKNTKKGIMLVSCSSVRGLHAGKRLEFGN